MGGGGGSKMSKKNDPPFFGSKIMNVWAFFIVSCKRVYGSRLHSFCVDRTRPTFSSVVVRSCIRLFAGAIHRGSPQGPTDTLIHWMSLQSFCIPRGQQEGVFWGGGGGCEAELRHSMQST